MGKKHNHQHSLTKPGWPETKLLILQDEKKFQESSRELFPQPCALEPKIESLK